MRGALDRRTGATFDELAAQSGFSSATAMGRSFSEAYGLSPLTYRKAVAATAPGDSEDSQRRWESWLTEIT